MGFTQNIAKEKLNCFCDDDTSPSNLPDVVVDSGVKESILMYLQHLVTVMHYHIHMSSEDIFLNVHFSNNHFSFLLQTYRFVLLDFSVLVVCNEC